MYIKDDFMNEVLFRSIAASSSYLGINREEGCPEFNRIQKI